MRGSIAPVTGELRTRDGARFEQAISAQIAPLKFVSSADLFFGKFRWAQDQQLHVGRATNGQVRANSLGASRAACTRFVFCFQVTGRGTIEQHGRRAEIAENQVSVYRSDTPYELAFPVAGERVGIAISADALGVAMARLDRLTGTRIDEGSPLISTVSRSIIEYERTLHLVPAAHRGQVLDLIVNALKAAVVALPGEERRDPRSELFERASAHIEKHLDDPTLSPPSVAKALFVSPRSLQQAFAASETGVARMIRERRLERAVRELADPTLTHLPIGEIAMRSGFTSASYFAELVRQRLGVLPRDLRPEPDAA